MRVFVTGGTGFVGPAIVRAILARGHEVTALVHRDEGPLAESTRGLTLARGDVTDPSSFQDAVRGHDAVAHLVAIRRERPEKGLTFERMHVLATRHVVAAARAAGARRFLHMSASGAKPKGTTYHETRWMGEEVVKSSDLDWTIFRPTTVTGPPEAGSEGFDHEFAAILNRIPVGPSFGGGDFPMQPVAKRDVADAFANALEAPKSVGKTYLLAGADRMTWNEYVRTLGDVLGKRIVLAPAPRWLVLPVAGALGRFRWFPATRDELAMLMEGHAGDSTPAAQDLGIRWTPFREALEDALIGHEWGAKQRR